MDFRSIVFVQEQKLKTYFPERFFLAFTNSLCSFDPTLKYPLPLLRNLLIQWLANPLRAFKYRLSILPLPRPRTFGNKGF